MRTSPRTEPGNRSAAGAGGWIVHARSMTGGFRVYLVGGLVVVFAAGALVVSAFGHSGSSAVAPPPPEPVAPPETAADLAARGDAALSDGQWQAALDAYSEASRLEPDLLAPQVRAAQALVFAHR